MIFEEAWLLPYRNLGFLKTTLLVIVTIGNMDEIHCVHCHRIDGRLWDGPVPCCQLVPLEVEVEEEFWDWSWLNPESILYWTPSGGRNYN